MLGQVDYTHTCYNSATPIKVNVKDTMTGWGTVSGSPSLLRGMPKRAPVGVGKSVQSSPLLPLRLKTWRILIGDLRLFLPLLFRATVFFVSVLHSLVLLLLLWRIACLSSHQWNVKMTSSSNSSIRNQSLIKTNWCTDKQPKNSYSQAQKDSVRNYEVWLYAWLNDSTAMQAVIIERDKSGWFKQ